MFFVVFSETIVRRFSVKKNLLSVKKLFLKIPEYSQDDICAESLFLSLQTFNLIFKKDLSTVIFLWISRKF